MYNAEKVAWIAFKDVITKFLGNTKDPNYKNIVEKMLGKIQNIGMFYEQKFTFIFCICIRTSF